MLSGTRSALAPCRPAPSGAAVSARSGQTAPKMRVHLHPVPRPARIRVRAPCRPTRALCRRHTSIFLPRTASGRSACTLAAKFPNASRACGSDFGRAHRKAPKPERGKLPACRAFLHRHTQAPFDLALQTDAPPADNTVRFRTGACADERGKRGLTRRVEEWVTPQRPASPSRPPSL